MATAIVDGGGDLLELDDPLEAEGWASAVLGSFYKVDAPLDARLELERTLWPTVLETAEARADEVGLAALVALTAVMDDAALAAAATAAVDRIQAQGIDLPSWAAELGTAAFEDAWMLVDVFGDHEAYFATFRYPGRAAHVVNALYDKAMGEIIKDGFVGYAPDEVRHLVPVDEGVTIVDVDPAPMARRIIDAVASGDLYLDNDWTAEFKRFRALILARMRSLPVAQPLEPPEPLPDEVRDALIAEFLAGAPDIDPEPAEVVAMHCLEYSCDYLGEDGLRWSPIVVEQFLMDYLIRRVSMDLPTVRQVPVVLRAWVRFALAKRGLDERWIAEAEGAVDLNEKRFLRSMTDAGEFGPAKSIGDAMLADGVDLRDQAAIDRWIAEFNERPIDERDELLGPPRRPGR